MKEIDWGSAPAWFGAIVTSLALLIAAVAFFDSGQTAGPIRLGKSAAGLST